MKDSAQRATLVLEHIAIAADDTAMPEGDSDSWNVVAYLIMDSGQRRRATLSNHGSREEAAAALESQFQNLTK